MKWTHEQAAAVLGMPVHEILAVAQVGPDHVITTHDGQHTEVTADGVAHALKHGATADDLAALGLGEDSAQELDDARRAADPLLTDPLAAQRLGLDPNAAEIAEHARQAAERGAQTPGQPSTPPPVRVPNPAAGGLDEADVDGEQGEGDGGQGDLAEVETGPVGDVPDGNADAVLDWVGDDVDRAARALAAEQGRERPRNGLITALQKKTEPQG